MSTVSPAIGKDFASDGLPLFLGDPNAKPEPIPPEYPWQYILQATHLIHEKYHRDPWPPEDRILRSIIESAFILGQAKLEKLFKGWLLFHFAWGETPEQAWDSLRSSLRPPEDILKFTNFEPPPLERKHRKSKTALCSQPAEKIDHQDEPGREITRRPIVEPYPISTPGKQKATIIPIRKLQQPLSRSTFLADQWKLDSRWSKLTPCAIAVLYALLWRTYHKATFQKIKDALRSGRSYFPWCLKGIESLSRRLTYTTKGKKIEKHYKNKQIKRALKQIEDLGFISTFFQGFKGLGAGKCFVFLNPKMSAAFHRESKRHKTGSTG